MITNISAALGQLSDRDVLARVHDAVRDERVATARLIALLMEVDARRLYLGEGYSSLFTYCTQVLHLSEHAAYNRIETARAARRFPVILELVEAAAVTLTTIRLLAPHLTAENHREVLERARHKSKRDIEMLVACLHPQPDVPPVVRKLPAPTVPALSEWRAEECVPAPRLEPPAAVAVPLEMPVRRPAEVKPLAPERYKIQVTVSRETYDTLRRAQDLLRHSVPNGDPAIIIARALTLLVSELEQKKIAATVRPRPAGPANTNSRHIPASVKRTVWQRDGARCAFKGAKGRCSETGFLEYHHVVPFAAGGETSADNIELRCRNHNQHEADLYFGSAQVPMLRERRPVYGMRSPLVPGTSRADSATVHSSS